MNFNMGIDNLFRQLKDIQFQADKILKSPLVEQEAIEKYASYSEKIKHSLIEMGLNEELLIHVNDIEKIDPNYEPKMPIGIVLFGALSFGMATKKHRLKKREAYFRAMVKNSKVLFSHIDFLMKEI